MCQLKFKVGDVIIDKRPNGNPRTTILGVYEKSSYVRTYLLADGGDYWWGRYAIETFYELDVDYMRYEKLKELFNEK